MVIGLSGFEYRLDKWLFCYGLNIISFTAERPYICWSGKPTESICCAPSSEGFGFRTIIIEEIFVLIPPNQSNPMNTFWSRICLALVQLGMFLSISICTQYSCLCILITHINNAQINMFSIYLFLILKMGKGHGKSLTFN